MFELLIFDLDGTLIDSRVDIALGVNLTLDRLGVPRRDPELIFTYIGGGVHNLMRNSLTEGHEDMLERGVELFWASYKEHVLDTTRPYPGVREMMERLTGKKAALATNKPYDHTRIILEGLGLDRYFVSVQGWRLGLPVKPDPSLVLMAIEEAGTPKERAVMIGDGVSDVRAAGSAGIKSCAVGYGYGSRDKLMEAGPDYFAEDVSDILRLFG